MAYRRYSLANPWVQIVVGAIFVTASEIFLKKGAAATAHLPQRLPWLGLAGLTSVWVWWGILCVIISFLSWLYVLRYLPITVAFPLSNVVHILVPLACWYWLGERIALQRWCGILLVLVGLMVVARPFTQIEEKL